MRSVRDAGGYSARLLVAAALLAGAGLALQRPAAGQPPPATGQSPPAAADASITADDLRREVDFSPPMRCAGG